MIATFVLALAVLGPPTAEPSEPPPPSKLPGTAESAAPPPSAPAEPTPAPAIDDPAPTVDDEVWTTPEAPPASAAAPLRDDAQPRDDAPAPTVAKRKVRPPRAIRWRLDPFLEGGSTTVFDPGYRALDAGRNLAHLGTGLRIDARLRGPVFLGTGLRYGFARTAREPYDGALSTKLVMHELQVIARLSIVLREGIDLVGQLDGGPSWRRLDVGSSERTTATHSLGGSFAARGGLSLYLPKAWLAAKGAARATAGIDLLFGSAMRTPLHARPRPAGADDDIGLVGTPLGDVTVTGFTWTIGVFVRVM